jgi:putative oxidoreductase
MNPLVQKGVTFYDRFAHMANHLQSFGLLVIRLAWGWESFESGRGHLQHVFDTADFFRSLHIPFPVANVYISGTTEMVGGILLMLGLFSRFISIPLLFNFAVTYLTDARGAVQHLFTDPDKFIDYTAFPFLVTALLILAFGAGKFSVDYLIARFVLHHPSEGELPGFPVATR